MADRYPSALSAFNPWLSAKAARSFATFEDVTDLEPRESRWSTLTEIFTFPERLLGTCEIDVGPATIDPAVLLMFHLWYPSSTALVARHLANQVAAAHPDSRVALLSDRSEFHFYYGAASDEPPERASSLAVTSSPEPEKSVSTRARASRTGQLGLALVRTVARRLRGRPVILASRHRVTEDLFGRGSSQVIDAQILHALERIQPRRAVSPHVQERLDEFQKVARTHAAGLSPAARFAVTRIIERVTPQLAAEVMAAVSTGRALDILDPNGVLAIGWIGGNHHAVRQWCRRNGRPFLVRQHGYILGWEGHPETRWVDADVYLGWTGGFGRWVDDEYNPGVMFVPVSHTPATEPCRRLRPHDTNQTVLFAPSAHPDFLLDAYLEFWDQAIALKEQCPDLDVRARTHLYGRLTDSLAPRLEAGGVPVDLGGGESGVEAARRARVVVTTASTMAVDAAMTGADVIVFNDIRQPDQLQHHPFAEHVSSPEALVPAIHRVFEDEATRARLEAGRAALRATYREPGVRLDQLGLAGTIERWSEHAAERS